MLAFSQPFVLEFENYWNKVVQVLQLGGSGDCTEPKCLAKVLTMPAARVRVLLLQFMELIGLRLGLPRAEWPICTIGSHDYCHTPLGVSLFSFAIQNVWEMTTVVTKIACRLFTACPPPIVLRLFIADTISLATIFRHYIKIRCTWQKYGKFYCHNYGTAYTVAQP